VHRENTEVKGEGMNGYREMTGREGLVATERREVIEPKQVTARC